MIRRFLHALSANQLELSFDVPPRDGASLLQRLRALGLDARIERCELTNNRTVMVSCRGGVLRVHEAYLAASPRVWRAIAVFVGGKTRRSRREAERVIVEFAPRESGARRPRRVTRPRREDAPVLAELSRAHEAYNRRYFDGLLQAVAISVSRRMKSRLGQYTVAGDGVAPEIAISRSHIRRESWTEVLHTLLHEMVHQWQAECGLPLDHGRAFRDKAREVGIEPRARRSMARVEENEPRIARAI
ncbi:MAG: SprT-like domain-containing protein [Gemmatimonadaceae bacterium]